MNRFLITMAAGVLLVACGEGSGEHRSPEDYIPDDVREQVLNLEPVPQACAMHVFMLKARVNECGSARWGRSSAPSSSTVDSCSDGADAAYDASPDYAQTLEECLDFIAAASCAALAGDHPCALTDDW